MSLLKKTKYASASPGRTGKGGPQKDTVLVPSRSDCTGKGDPQKDTALVPSRSLLSVISVLKPFVVNGF